MTKNFWIRLGKFNAVVAAVSGSITGIGLTYLWATGAPETHLLSTPLTFTLYLFTVYSALTIVCFTIVETKSGGGRGKKDHLTTERLCQPSTKIGILTP